MKTPRVGVIIATHNRATLLPNAIQSALAAGADPEVVVVDDASTDSTPQVCREFSQIKVVRLEKNVGLAAARNAGIRASGGQHLTFLDDDDQRLPNSLPPQLAALEKNPAAVLCYAPVLIAGANEQIPPETPSGDLFWKLVRGNFMPGLSVVIRRQPLFDAGLFDARLRQVEDWDLWLRLSERFHVCAIPTPVAIYRMCVRNSRQLSANHALMTTTAGTVQLRALQLPRARVEPEKAQLSRKYFLETARYTLSLETIEALRAGDKKSARQYLRVIFRLLPGTLRHEEFRALVRLSLPARKMNAKKLKAIRKKIWARGLPDYSLG